MKNRIWKKILAVGVSLLAEAGMLVGCTAQPAVAYGAEMEGGLSVAQDAAWTDLQKFQAVISVKADGLASLTWENENQEYESGDENLFSSGNQDGSLENDQYDFSDETISHPTSYELVVWLSEYFQPDASFMAPEGCLKEELPIETADGRSSSITGFRWKINPGEQGKQLKIPVTLRDEYRFPAEKHTVPTCQDILHANGAISGEENGGGVYIVKKVENEKNILCKALSKSLEIPAAHMDFSVEMEAKEKALYTGKRIHMAVNLTNNGQVPFYKISLQAKVKEQELVPVWEKEPGLEVLESGAVLECLSAGETRTLSFYIDPDMNQKSNLELFAKTENPVSLEKAAEKQLTLQQGKASFTVKKTADCDNASPGETVTYQISIHNTGEVTLHSVVTTERFGLAGVTATFQEQRGITLNKSRTQAKIQEIAPGGCVNLKAKVVLPKDLKDQNLMNQIIVVTDETGEESAVRDQATIRVEDKEKDGSGNGSGNGNGGGNGDGTGIGSGNNDGSTMAASTSPKTGDTSHKELFQVLILLSFLFSAVAARRMFGDNAHR